MRKRVDLGADERVCSPLALWRLARRHRLSRRRVEGSRGAAHGTMGASAFAWKQKGAYAAAFEEAMVSAHNAR
jgi:hypothetical protein